MNDRKIPPKRKISILVLLLAFFLALASLGNPGSDDNGLRYALAPAVLAAIIAAGGTLTAAGINAGSNAYSNRQNQKNWEKQNEYNSPAKQLERYRVAGLNPNLLYGNGQSSAGNAGALAPYESTKVSTGDVLQMAQALAQAKNLDANARKAENEALGAELDNQYKAISLQHYNTQLDLDNRLRGARLGYLSGLTTNLGYQRSVMEAQAQNYLENARYTQYNRESLQPALLSIRRQQVANDTARTKGMLENWFTERIGARTRNSILSKDLLYYDSDRRLRRRSGALGAASQALGAITGFGRFYDARSFNHTYWDYPF